MKTEPDLGATLSKLPFGFVLLVLVVFSALLSWLIQEQYGFWQPDRADVDWKGAEWIGCRNGSDAAYLRRTFALPERPVYASLAVAGVDQFDVHVNGRRIGHEEYLGARPSGAYDLSRLLDPGLNVVAIQTKSSTQGLGGQAIAHLKWKTGGSEHVVLSKGDWLCDSRERVGALGQNGWADRDYQATDWRHASVVDSAAASERKLLRPSLPTRIVEEGPSGSWIWHEHRSASVGGFERVVRIDDRYIKTAWLGVSTAGQYFFAVNEIVVGPVSGSSRRMDMLDIGPYLNPGENRVTIQVAGYSRPTKLAVTGLVESEKGIQRFSSDARWRRTPDSAPALVLGNVSQDRPALVRMERVEIRNFEWRQLRRRLSGFGLVFGAVLLLWPAFLFSFRRVRQSAARASLQFCQPFAFCTVALALVRLATWDPRVNITPQTVGFILFCNFAIIATWLSAFFARERLAHTQPLEPTLTGSS